MWTTVGKRVPKGVLWITSIFSTKLSSPTVLGSGGFCGPIHPLHTPYDYCS
jgi:hypothetical protein